MLGVDKLDQLMSYYCFLHKSVKWWRKVFFWITEMCVVNSYIIYQQTLNETKQRPNHLTFRRSLIRDLIEPLLHKKAQSLESSLKVYRLNHRIQHFAEKRKKRRDCVVCSDRGIGERHLTPFVCTTCTDEPALCPGSCFKLYHTKQQHRVCWIKQQYTN